MAANRVKQKDLQELLGLSGYSIYKKVNGHEDFSLAQVRIICEHYNISADIFLGKEVEKT